MLLCASYFEMSDDYDDRGVLAWPILAATLLVAAALGEREKG
jgi:hypothetical protein